MGYIFVSYFMEVFFYKRKLYVADITDGLDTNIKKKSSIWFPIYFD